MNMKDELQNEKILADLTRGELKWGEIAKKHDVNMRLVQSIYAKNRVTSNIEKIEKGGYVQTWKGMRLSDGKPSPVKKYHISELQN